MAPTTATTTDSVEFCASGKRLLENIAKETQFDVGELSHMRALFQAQAGVTGELNRKR